MTEEPHDESSGAGAEDPVGKQPDPAHGSVGEEAAKLADAVHDWLGEWRGVGGLGGLGGHRAAGSGRASAHGDVWAAATAPAPPPSADGAECRMCPICQGLRLLRGSQPEVFEHLSDAAASVAAALRELLGDAARGHGSPRDRPPDVERIDLG